MTAIDIDLLQVGVMVWTKGTNEFGDDATGGMVVDFGIDEANGPYVIALVPQPTYPKTSHKRRRWLYSRTDDGKITDHGQVAELRRLYVDNLAPTDGFRDPAKCLGFASKALLAAGLRGGEWGDDRADLDRAAHALIDAAAEEHAERDTPTRRTA